MFEVHSFPLSYRSPYPEETWKYVYHHEHDISDLKEYNIAKGRQRIQLKNMVVKKRNLFLIWFYTTVTAKCGCGCLGICQGATAAVGRVTFAL